MFTKTMKFLFTPRTNSPTKAYYLGMLAGAYLTHTAYVALATRREEQMWRDRYVEAEQNLIDFETVLNATRIED